ETVAALNLLGINTSASCEGHLDWGLAGPWIDTQSSIDTSDLQDQQFKKFDIAEAADKNNTPKDEVDALFQEAHALTKAIRRPHLEEAEKLMNLLSEFYQNRQVPFDVQLSLVRFGPGMRLQNQGIEL